LWFKSDDPMTTEARKPNRLIHETSPYLLQHAHNPVDWWPWSDEAFAEARRRNVPVFLSIGYSTCYWCHVMERESFEDEAIAAQMNKDFVCIKVDREERPDVDEVYMAATVMMTGRGGWPMSVFLEPAQRRPFWCGTYFPARAHPGLQMPTFPQVLDSLSKAYREQKDAVEQQSEELARAVREHLAGAAAPAQLSQEQVADAVTALLKIFDRTNGGFGQAPKFPQPVFLEFLLDARARAADDSTADAIDQAVRRTLDKMACGGIRDHVGGGFHRYAVDAYWLVPHFEKMLYDNAQLARVYARAARWYGDSWYESVARETLAYVQREMTGEGGGFYSAQDAEVDGREGLNYLWTPDEIRAALGPDNPEDADFAIKVYGLDQGTNFKDPHHPEEPARNVLRLDDRPDRIASQFNLSIDGFNERLKQINARLYAARMQRKQPRLDDKVLTAWNGLMIGAFATAARELEAPELLAPAQLAADFVLSDMIEPGAGLLRSYRAGVAKTPAFLEDHACLMHGLLELARSTSGEARTLNLKHAQIILALAKPAFFDETTGAIYDTRADSTELFVRTRSTHDGATPAGISVMLHALLDLADLTKDAALLRRAVQGLAAISSAVAESPVGTINSTRALLRMLIGDSATAEALTHAPPPKQPLKSASEVLPVEIYASIDRITVAQDTPAEFTLVIKIADGYHIPAADPGDSPAARSLIPFRVGIVNGTGIVAYAAYPEGETYADEIRVYKGSFELTVALERKGPITGRPLISVMYQACTDTECLAPVTVELDIALT
jgi:uncharacterized protein YyaL (SSP411 family)